MFTSIVGVCVVLLVIIILSIFLWLYKLTDNLYNLEKDVQDLNNRMSIFMDIQDKSHTIHKETNDTTHKILK